MAEHIRVVVDGDADDLRRALRGAAADLKLFGSEAQRQSRTTDTLSSSINRTDRSFADLGRTVNRTNSGFSLLRNTFNTLKIPALLGAAGAGAEGLVALAGAATSLVSALAPLSGALVAYPAMLGAIGQAAGVVALGGLGDLTEALAGNEEAIKRLTPEGRELLETLKDLEPEYRKLQTTAQKPLFGGIEKGVDSALKNLPALREVIRDTAEEMGGLAEQAGRFLGRDGFGEDFETIGGNNAEMLGTLGDAGFHFADALRHVMVEAGPLLDWMAEGILSFSKWTEAQARAGRESGELADFFHETEQAISRVVDIGGSLIGTLMNIGGAAKPFGEDMLVDLRDAADELERLTGSVEGQHDLKEYFAESERKVRELALALEDILDEGSLGESIAKAIELAVPEIARNAGQIGVAIAKGLYEGFLSSDLLGQLFVGATLFKIFGGGSVFALAGKRIGGRMGGAAGPAFGAAMAVWALANREELIDTLVPEGPIRDAFHDVFDDLAPIEAADAFNQDDDAGFFEKADRALKSWVNTASLGLIDLRSNVEPTIDDLRDLRLGLDRTASAATQMGNGVRITHKDFKAAASGVDFFGDKLDDTADRMARFAKMVEKKNDVVGDSVKETGKAFEDFAGEADRDFSKVTGSSGKMAKGVGGNSASMVNAVSDGLRTFGQNVNEALSAFQVKKVSYSIKDVGKSVGNIIGAQKGAIVPGSGSGDTVPLHVGGQLAAMVEPGEQVSVLNRKATRTLMDYNAAVPRFAAGGALDFALGPHDAPPIQYAADHAGGNSHWHITGTTTPWVVAIGKKLQQMGHIVGEHPAFGGVQYQHSATGGHYDALAIDVNSGDGESMAESLAVARVLGGSGVGGAIAEKIARVILGGPKGSMRDLGQGALDKVRAAANKFVAAQAPKMTEGSLMSGDGDVERVFAQVAKRLSNSKTATLALGMAGYAESGMRDLSYGDASSQGALQLLASTASSMGINPHDEGAIASAFLLRGYFGRGGANSLAASGLPAHLVAQGVQGSAFSDGSNYAAQRGAAQGWMQRFGLQRGGLVPHLAGGGSQKEGKGHSIDFHVASGLGVPITEAQKLARKLRKFTAERGSIAKMDERISIAERLADADGVTTPSEIARQVRLQRRLLEDLKAANRLSGEGYRWASRAGAPGKNLRGLFRSTQTDMSGILGRGGRILDTKLAIQALLGTDTTDPALTADLSEQLRVSQLTAALSERQYGTFSGFFDEFRSQLPFVGSFDHGTARVERTGFARVHKGEEIRTDPQGPYGNALAAGGKNKPPVIQLTFADNSGQLVRLVDARVDDRAAKVVNRQIGRRSRQLAVAPGR